MASNIEDDIPNPQHARETLAALGRDRGRLADRLSAPSWFQPTVAILTAVAAIAPALPYPWALIVPAVFVVLIGALPIFTRRNGVAMSVRPTGRATRVLLSLQVGALAVFMVVSAAIRVFELQWWWIAPVAASVFILILVLGRRYDRAQHDEMSSQERSQ